MPSKWLISADSHVMEPPDLWAKALTDKHGDAVPREIGEWQGQKGRFYFTGIEAFKLGELVEGEGALKEQLIKATEDPAARLACNDEDGIWAEILNATNMLYSMRMQNHDLARNCCAVFNDWLIEHCSQDPKRLLGTAMIYMENVDWAVKELERAKKNGLVQAIINCDAREDWEPYRSPVYDPFWAKAEELGMAVVLHIITGNARDSFTLHGKDRENGPRCGWGIFTEAGAVLSNEFIFGGILDRFPNLKVVLSEYEVSWLIYWMFRTEQRQKAFGPAQGLSLTTKPIKEYMSNVFHGIIDDPFVEKALDVIDPKTVMWGSDFPHPRCTFPNSEKIVDETFGNLPQQVQDDLAFYNAARFYNIDVPKAGRAIST